MRGKQTFEDGFIAGWVSIMGSRLVVPEFPAQPIPKQYGSDFLHGLLKGQEAARKKIAEMASENSN
jgi:hypothetical protein